MLRWNVDVQKYEIVILFDMFLNLSFKMTTSFANIARNLYTRKDFKS